MDDEPKNRLVHPDGKPCSPQDAVTLARRIAEHNMGEGWERMDKEQRVSDVTVVLDKLMGN